MQDWQLRVIDEKAALDLKLVRLKDARRKGRLDSLSGLDAELLQMQQIAMEAYSLALRMRIDRFGLKDA